MDLHGWRHLRDLLNSQVFENFVSYDLIFEEGNDLHREPAPRTGQRRNEVDFLNPICPSTPTGLSKWCIAGVR